LITFPDPFMGKHQEHWRLMQISVLVELRRILTGRLYLATDHEGYHEWSHAQVDAFNSLQRLQHESSSSSTNNSSKCKQFELVESTPDRSLWLPVVSKYEQKGWDEGRVTWLSCWQ
jgi:tRNA G46 methylase TrmB